MRISTTIFIVLFSVFSVFAQDKPVKEAVEEAVDAVKEAVDAKESVDSLSMDTVPKYQSLFWKIEHPKYDKPSYLYGTMHVSHKIAYHLNDEFYQALKDVDRVGLETNPEDWMDKMLEFGGSPYGGYGRGGGGLYESFTPRVPEKDDIKSILQMNNQIVNSILYRNNEYQQNFEEETYLDMFIFQAGGKQGKEVVALEDLHEADELVKKASQNAYDPKRELSPWLKKKLQEKGVGQLIEDAYRDKNLDLIDSLNREYYNEKYNEYMLYQRNRNIVEAMDTVMQKGTLFVGIGAAHLPGEDGVIDYLRQAGYTLTPIEGELTKKGKDIKEDFETNFSTRKHEKYSSADGLVDLSLPEKLYEFGMGGQSVGLGMDITNGAYFFMFRMSTYKNFAKEPFTLDDIEDMLYENIPGKIKQQERRTFQGYPALYVANETKSGEHQKYMIVETPLEFIVFKLGGKKDYASINESKFFDKIRIKNVDTPSGKDISPFYGDFKVTMPFTPIINGNNETLSGMGPLEIQAIDTTSGQYYFAKELVYHDLRYFEEDKFEVEYLHKAWYDGIDTVHENIVTDMSGIATASSNSHTKEGDEVWLKTMKKGPRYYMLGTVGVGEAKSKEYFGTFEFVPYIHKDEKYEQRVDTTLHFSVNAPVKAPPYFDYYRSRTEEDTIGNIYKDVTYQTPYNEFVSVYYRKYHSYYQTENIDSIWVVKDRNWLNPYDRYGNREEEEKIEIFDQKKGKTKDGHESYSFKVKSKGSSRVIHNHYMLNYGIMYTLQWDGYEGDEPSEFLSTFLETFTPADSLMGRSPMSDKKELFFENIYSTDSLTRAQSLESYEYVEYKPKDIPRMIDIIKNFKFTDKELHIKVGILEELGRIEDPRALAFMRDIYLNSEYNSLIQLEVINALAKNANVANMKTILSFMDEDIPLSNMRSIENAFSPLSDTTAWNYSKILFPELLEYSSIPEYKNWIYELAVILKDAKMLKSKHFRKYKKQWLNEMKIEFKRQKTKEIKDKSNSNNYGYGGRYGNSSMSEFISLLISNYKDKEVKEQFDKLNTLEDSYTKAFLQAQLAKNNLPTSNKIIQELAEDPKTRSEIFGQLKQVDKLDKFPKEFYTQKHLAEAYILSSNSYPSIDSIIYIKEIIVNDGEDDHIVYFYRVMKEPNNYGGYEKKEGDWGIKYIAFKIDEEEKVVTKTTASSSFSNTDHEDKKEMKEFEKGAIDKIKYRKRKRVRTSSYNDYYGY